VFKNSRGRSRLRRCFRKDAHSQIDRIGLN